MTLAEQELSEEDLNSFLEEIGVSEPNEEPSTGEVSEKSAEELVEEVIHLTLPSPPSDRFHRKPFSAIEEKKPKRARLSLLLSLAILCGFLMGGLFGFFLGKTETFHTKPTEKIETIHTKLFFLINELKEIYEKSEEPMLEYDLPKEEIIEPISPPSEIKLSNYS